MRFDYPRDRSFYDIYLAGNQISSSYVSRINTLVTLKALSTDLHRLKSYYEYKIQILGYDKAKYQSDLNEVSIQVTDYKKDSTVYIGTGENIVKIESNSSETYNALLAKQIELSNKIASIDTEISDYQKILEDIEHATATQEDFDLVESYLARLDTSFTALENQFAEFIAKYNETYLKDGTSFTEVKYQSNSIFSGSFIVHTVKVGAPIMLATMLGIAIFYLQREIRKQKTNN